jgi:magnesium-transporting ATPase (P-type)
MGIQGTEVAKGASDMILMDDDFCSIVAAVEKGRVIYAGIQKFVAFIMSVHIAEVMQIFFCVVCGIPLMRSPLQILFLILVTDLPPSIALGMEPGDPSILKQMPRPKDEQIVLPWMWWSIVINGALLSGIIIAIYLGGLWHYCDENITGDDIDSYAQGDGSLECLRQARTVAFIALVYAENIRAYIARSFYLPFWTNFLANKQMQKAIIMAQIALYIAVLIPGFNTKILGLDGWEIGWKGWLASFAGPFLTVVLCDAAKVITFYQNKWYQEKVAKQREAEEAARAKQAAAAPAAPTKAVEYSAPAPPAPAKGPDTTTEATKSSSVTDKAVHL